MKERILILGASGMLGASIFRYFGNSKKFNVIGTLRSISKKDFFTKNLSCNLICDIDALDIKAIEKIICDFRPNYVINCIGVIKQLDGLKSKEILLNSVFPHLIAELCSRKNCKLIHFSTDCVFSGKKGMYSESDIADARDSYGLSKFLGEINTSEHLTIRTSLIGHELESEVSLVNWFLSQKGKIDGYSKAIFSGFPTVYIAEFLFESLLKSKLNGVYHLASDPIDKFSLLNLIAFRYNMKIQINDSNILEIDRSLNSKLLDKALQTKHPKWEQLIEKMHYEYSEFFK
jgi:dTDP-4-dehydrorhamnose reductase